MRHVDLSLPESSPVSLRTLSANFLLSLDRAAISFAASALVSLAPSSLLVDLSSSPAAFAEPS